MTAERGNLELLSPGGPVGEQMIRSGHGGGVGDVCPWQLAECLMSPTFLKPETAMSPQDPCSKEPGRWRRYGLKLV